MDTLCYNGEVSYRYENISMEDADVFFSAVADGDYSKMVKMLDEERAHVNQTDSDGFSALMIAASEGYEKLVEELIRRDCNVNTVTLNRNNTPLFFAAKVGWCVYGLMDREEMCVSESSFWRRIENSSTNVIISEVHSLSLDWFIETPLLWSCYSGHYDFFMYLLGQKAEIRAISMNETTCLIGACLGPEESRAKLVTKILQLWELQTSLVIDRCPKIIDVQDVDGQTALHVAATNGNLACVKILLDAGADSTLRDVEGLTPLQQAEKCCYPECAEVLEKKWKELEDRARAELEELLRDEGIDESELYQNHAFWVMHRTGKRSKKNRRNKKKKPEVNSIHPQYQCDGCKSNRPISGIRYSCQVRVNEWVNEIASYYS